jgi:hypothetical protein
MSEHRNDAIDLFRGIVICNMIIMHFSGFFPRQIALLIEAFDFAIEGFLFLSGLMIGRHYFPKFIGDRVGLSKKLLLKSLKIASVEYLLIITISLPFNIFFRLIDREKIVDFVMSSFLFLNQIPIIHILPIFIPLFLISPVILQILAKDKERWLIAGSIGVFAFGCKYPYFFSVGDKAIFPIVLWQIYFICGCILGKMTANNEVVDSVKLIALAGPMFGLCLLMKFGSYFEEIRLLKATYDIYPKKFPLNAYGLAYGSTLLVFVYALLMAIWDRAKMRFKFFNGLALLGRHSLEVFVLHAYLVYLLRAVTAVSYNKVIVYVGMGTSFVLIYLAAAMIDKKSQAGRLPVIYRLLFR